jgi:hypothetical protein
MAFYNRTYILTTIFAIFFNLYFCIVFAVTNNTPAHLQPVPSWLQCNNTNANQASFFGRIRPSCEISKIKDEVVCWATAGDWYFNSSVQIVDDINLYKPCLPYYGPKNPCAWMLDGPGLKYYWHPKSNCSIPEGQYRSFDVEDFCDLMKDRGPLMVVGDSVSELSSLSFKNLIYSKTGIRNCTQSGTEGPFDVTNSVPNVFPTCHNLRIYQMRDDYLSLSSSEAYATGNMSDYGAFTWTENIGFLNVSMLLLNRGSHYVSDDLLLPQVNETLHFITTRFPHVQVIWRNTPHGHMLYKNYALAHPLPRTPANLNMYDESPARNPWGYGHFRRQNNLVHELLQKHYPQVLYLDVFDPTILRADSRYNAIHPCVPGVYDTWLEMIYNALVLLLR